MRETLAERSVTHISSRFNLACLLSLILAMSVSARAQLQEQEARLIGPPTQDRQPLNRTLLGEGSLYLSAPLTLTVAELDEEIESADITDVEVADFSGDGRNDIAVAWYATDLDEMEHNRRFLTIYVGTGGSDFVRAADIDLYIPNYAIEALSVFRNGPSDIGVGDFDGDGDPDLAVTPFFGDELWFVENLGAGTFSSHLKYPFGFNTTGNFQTPPEALAADFDGDGRDELVYIVDPTQYIQGDLIHFWTTDGTIADMQRVSWEGVEGPAVQWTRGLAIADFDGDQRPDLCFSGSVRPPEEDDPALVFWHDLNTVTRKFAVHLVYPSFICSDVVAVQPDPDCLPGVLVTDRDGTEIEFWAHQSGPELIFQLVAAADGYAGLAEDRGMTGVLADVDGDGDSDLVTRQKLGELSDTNQVEITLSSQLGRRWTRVAPTPISTLGFQDEPYSEILRPRNLAAADLFGNTLPEIVAGFGPAPLGDENGDDEDEEVLRVAYWRNSCVGDATVDGRTDIADLAAVLADFGDLPSNPNTDLDKDGRVDLGDLSIILTDYGCECGVGTLGGPRSHPGKLPAWP